MRVATLVLLALALSSCGEATSSEAADETLTPTAGHIDAGQEAFVKNVVPLLWGRKPWSGHEVGVLVDVVNQIGRAGLVRAMARAPDFVDWWEIWIRDALSIARIGYYSNAGCYGRKLQPEPLPDLAEHIRDKSHDKKWPVAWTMRDLIRSALVLDDLSPVWATNLVTDLSRALDDQNFLAAFGQRRNRVQNFLRTYLNRRMNCLGCHNSEWSITGHIKPELDRTWEIPGLFEKALFGQSEGRDHVDLTPFFRRRGVVAGYYYAKESALDDLCPMGMCEDNSVMLPEDKADLFYPWGWDPSCSPYFPPEKVRPDDAEDVNGFFIAGYDQKASVWDLQMALREGFSALRDGLVVNDDMSVDPNVAFAWLTSVNIADRVWQAAFGSRLTIVNYFPRNQMQRDILWDLTQRFVASGYSLVELLVAVTASPHFNGAAPAAGGDPHPYPPIFDPFVDDSIPVAERRNHLGHLIRRAPARVLLRTAYRALGWPETPEFLIYFMSPEARLQRNVGVFHKSADPGFSGVSFQSALSWESMVGICDDKTNAGQCSLQPIFDLPEGQISGTTLCELCGNKEYVCDWDPRCCDADWDVICALDCGPPGKINMDTFPQPQMLDGPDWIHALITQAAAKGATVGDAVRTIKDRLLTVPRLAAGGEAAAIETLMGVSLDAPVADNAEIQEALRAACGAFLASPDFLLQGAPSANLFPDDSQALASLVPMSGNEPQGLCVRIAGDLFGDKATCDNGSISVDPTLRQAQ